MAGTLTYSKPRVRESKNRHPGKSGKRRCKKTVPHTALVSIVLSGQGRGAYWPMVQPNPICVRKAVNRVSELVKIITPTATRKAPLAPEIQPM